MHNSTSNQFTGLARRSPLPTLGALQDIFGSVLTASLQVDGVLAELENERRPSFRTKRDTLSSRGEEMHTLSETDLNT